MIQIMIARTATPKATGEPAHRVTADAKLSNARVTDVGPHTWDWMCPVPFPTGRRIAGFLPREIALSPPQRIVCFKLPGLTPARAPGWSARCRP